MPFQTFFSWDLFANIPTKSYKRCSLSGCNRIIPLFYCILSVVIVLFLSFSHKTISIISCLRLLRDSLLLDLIPFFLQFRLYFLRYDRKFCFGSNYSTLFWLSVLINFYTNSDYYFHSNMYSYKQNASAIALKLYKVPLHLHTKDSKFKAGFAIKKFISI